MNPNALYSVDFRARDCKLRAPPVIEGSLQRRALVRLRWLPLPDHAPRFRFASWQRFALSTTSSFKALEPQWKDELARLHNDYYYHRQASLLLRSRFRNPSRAAA